MEILIFLTSVAFS